MYKCHYYSEAHWRSQPEYLELRRRGGRKGGRTTASRRRVALAAQDKEIFILRTKRYTIPQIAAAVGRSERTVYRSLARAKQMGLLA